ncbi:MAG: hypothetical protein HYZ16_03660 [Bacteroidetes bacterium]|jgi:hypothetical protein|nr:hypothetical protein [Bacteroidota bacterium]
MGRKTKIVLVISVSFGLFSGLIIGAQTSVHLGLVSGLFSGLALALFFIVYLKVFKQE